MMTPQRKAIGLALLLLCMAITQNAMAKDYLIEVVLFETVSGRDLQTDGVYLPVIEDPILLNTPDALAAGFLEVEQDLSLSENAAAIASSRRYNLLRHLAWRQPGLAEDIAVPIQISLGSTQNIYLPDTISEYESFIPASIDPLPDYTLSSSTSAVNGTIKVHLGRFLHMDVRLSYTDFALQNSYRLAQKRKMRSRELHYIDNPRFGILTRILPLEDTMPSSLKNEENITAIQ